MLLKYDISARPPLLSFFALAWEQLVVKTKGAASPKIIAQLAKAREEKARRRSAQQCIKMRVDGEGLMIRGYRFELDRLCKQARFDELAATFGAGFQGTSIPTSDSKLHSVFTEHLRDEHGNFRHGELQTLISYLQARI